MPRTPLAWKNLSHDPVRFALFVLGVVFAVVLMFVQLGFKGALLDSQTIVHDHLNADLVLVSPARKAIAMREAFPRRRLAQAAAVPGVADARPLYLDNGTGTLLNADTLTKRKPSRGIRVIGVDPDAFQLDLPELDPAGPEVRALRLTGAALFDAGSREGDDGESVFGPLRTGGETELAGRTVRFVGSVRLGPDFTTDGALIVSQDTFADILRRPYTPGAPLADVDLGLIRLAPGADAAGVKDALNAEFARAGPDPDVAALTRGEFRGREQDFWLRNTPIGFAFGFGTVMGFAVGLVICYQILSGDVADHLPEYATLKAVGYSNRYLMWVVLQEALILAAAGFAAGLGISVGLYRVIAWLTALPMNLGVERALTVLAATVVMCVASGLIALVRLVRADPADVFG